LLRILSPAQTADKFFGFSRKHGSGNYFYPAGFKRSFFYLFINIPGNYKIRLNCFNFTNLQILKEKYTL